MHHGHGTVGVDGNMRFLMNQEVITWPGTDNSEVVNECLLCLSVLERNLKAGVFCHSRRRILITGGFARAREPLRPKLSRPTNVVAVGTKCDQRVQGAASVHKSSGSPGGRGPGMGQITLRPSHTP